MAIKVDLSGLDGVLTERDWAEAGEALAKAAAVLQNGSGAGREFLGWRDLPENYDRDEFARIRAAARRIREQSDVLIVIGIGGSYIGARAVIELLGGPYFNDFSPLKIYFAGNNISAGYLNQILKHCEGKRLSVNVVSKSGTTTEPALAFRIFKRLMEERYGKEGAQSRIYVTTDRERGSMLGLARREGYETFVIPDDIGGRYSVLTVVGLLPIAAAGFDIAQLMHGAAAARKACSGTDLDNPANRYALARWLLYRGGRPVEFLASFEPAFTAFLEWWKQLFGESEGKDHKGILPASLAYSTDLHSMGQYLQDGPRMMFETMVRFAAPSEDIEIPAMPDDFDGLGYLAGRKLSAINDTAAEATACAHIDGGVPCMVITCDGFDACSAGELIYFFQRACGVSAYLLGVNPFDQPGVEAYKKNMFALLGRPGYESLRTELEAGRRQKK